ncbi:MAG: hypothetical protein ABSG68_08715 [Thermoguttaceae bacterium]|jgi:hypothetical protein
MSTFFNPVRYADIRDDVAQFTIALARPCGVEGRLICDATSAQYSHATALGWLFGGMESGEEVLLCGETREHIGARLIPFGDEIQRYPGGYDLFRVRRQFSRARAWAFMARAANHPYGWNHIVRVGLRRLADRWRMPCLKRFVAPIGNSDDPGWPRDCSALVHAALRQGGGPQLRAADSDVVPGDLADPRQFDYWCTPYWSDDQVDAAAIRAAHAGPRS